MVRILATADLFRAVQSLLGASHCAVWQLQKLIFESKLLKS